MSDSSSDSITVTTIHHELKLLLAGYQSEQAESQSDEDTYFIEYWGCACQTIYDAAAALNIPFEEPSEEQPSPPRPYKQRPHEPDSLMPNNADVQLSEEYSARLRHA